MTTRSRGWTLTEAMISVAILAILATLGAPLMTQVQRFYLQSESRDSIEKDARDSLNIINRFMRMAKSTTIVIDSFSAAEPPYSRVTFTTSDNRTMSFWQSGTSLYQKVGNSTEKLSGNLRFIAFTFPRTDDPSIISVSMTMEKSTYQGGSKALQLTIQKVRVMN
jgi:prepilin-type N-terminal cleavage/methylation domain-containing protein